MLARPIFDQPEPPSQRTSIPNRVSHYPDRIACSQARQTHTQATCQMQKSGEQAVGRTRAHISGDENRNDQRIDCNNTGHDDGNKGLEDGADQPTTLH